MKLETPDRRAFLRAAGVALTLPWLESTSRGAAESPPKRAVFICTALGLHGPSLYPAKAGADYETTEYLGLLSEHRAEYTFFSGLSHLDQGGRT